jgi:short-subunit dehydrogenase
VELARTSIHAISVHPIATATEFSEVATRESSGRKGAPIGPVQTAEQVALAMVQAVRRPRPEVHPYAMARGLVVLNALFPSLVDRWAGRAAKRKS